MRQRSLTLLIERCEDCPFIRYAKFDITHRTICSSEEAMEKAGGNTMIIFPSEPVGIPKWCPLPEIVEE